MARLIKFCNAQMYQGNTASSGDFYSEIFEVPDLSRLDAELRITAISGTTPSAVATFQTTSDPTFDNNAWQLAAGTAITGTAVSTYTGAFSGLGRFVRAKLSVTQACCATAMLQAVGREP